MTLIFGKAYLEFPNLSSLFSVGFPLLARVRIPDLFHRSLDGGRGGREVDEGGRGGREVHPTYMISEDWLCYHYESLCLVRT